MFTRCQRDGRQACCFSTGSKSEVRERERESGGLTTVQANKLEEMMLTTVIATTVCLFVTSCFPFCLSVTCQDISNTAWQIAMKCEGRSAQSSVDRWTGVIMQSLIDSICVDKIYLQISGTKRRDSISLLKYIYFHEDISWANWPAALNTLMQSRTEWQSHSWSTCLVCL